MNEITMYGKEQWLLPSSLCGVDLLFELERFMVFVVKYATCSCRNKN